MSSAPGIVFARMNIPAEIEDAYNEWYNAEHLPGTIEVPGFRAGRRYAQIAGENSQLKYSTVYELESAETFFGPEAETWRASFATRDSAGYREIRPRFQDFTPFIGRQILSSEDSYSPPEAEYLLAMLLEPEPELEEEFNAWYDTEHIPLLLQLPGVLTARRFTAHHAPGLPKYLALYDLDRPDALQGDFYQRLRTTPWSLRIRSRYRSRIRYLGQRVSPVLRR